jgi:hypothetical protein
MPFEEAERKLVGWGFTHSTILHHLLKDSYYFLSLYVGLGRDSCRLSFLGTFVLKGHHIVLLLDALRKGIFRHSNVDVVYFLLEHHRDLLLEYYDCVLLVEDYPRNGLKNLIVQIYDIVLRSDYPMIGQLQDKLLEDSSINLTGKFYIGTHISELGAAHQQKFRQSIWSFFDQAKLIKSSWELPDMVSHYPEKLSVYKFSIQFFKKYFPAELPAIIDIMVDEMQVLKKVLIDDLDSELGGAAIPYIKRYLSRKEALKHEDVVVHGIQFLTKSDAWEHRSLLFDIGTTTANKRILSEIAMSFQSLGSRVADELLVLLESPQTSKRFFAAFVLSTFEDEIIRQHLLGFVDAEKSDDTRDNLLEALKDILYPADFSFEALQRVIKKADQRKKLSGIKEKGVDIADLPQLCWSNGEQLSEKELTFVFYRNARSQGLNSDIEARLLTRFIDKGKSIDFSKYILKVFLNQGAQAKQKHLMTLAALLGNDSLVPTFEALFKSLIEEKRTKAAEMVIHSTMVIGTNKALRLVEFISRKYANKKPGLAEAARLALESAAKELSLSPDELADRIIPNFDFEDLQRVVEVDGETFRAMIDMDFSLVFYDENNKKRKSLPKTAPKELKEEMSTIAKDLKSVVRMQSGRMDHFLHVGKQWATGYWFDLFMNHPIMFVYATKQLWVAEHPTGKQTVFRVLEDALIVDIDDDEIDLDEFESILLYHPIYVDASTRDIWKQYCYDRELASYSPQVNRQVYTLETRKVVDGRFLDFPSTNIPKGAEFAKSYLDKRGWSKETIDGGALLYFKRFPELDLLVTPSIEGTFAFYYEGQSAKLESIDFRRFSNGKAHDLVAIPAVLISEVLLDMYYLIETQ